MRPLRESLFYTADGELDFGWAILLICCVVGLVVFVGVSFGWIPGPSVAAWSWFGSFTAMAFIAGAAISRARLIAKSEVPGAVARGIASAAPQSYPFGPPSYVFHDPSGVAALEAQ